MDTNMSKSVFRLCMAVIGFFLLAWDVLVILVALRQYALVLVFGGNSQLAMAFIYTAITVMSLAFTAKIMKTTD